MEEVFAPLAELNGVRAAFVPRIAGLDVATDRATALVRLAPAHAEFLKQRGFDPGRLATAEQVHGARVAVAEEAVCHGGADALVTGRPDVVLGIYVADCAAVYLADRKGRGIGLVHSGRAGTEANIVTHAIIALRENFGIAPDDLTVEISPCIRPPLYETDFAALIAEQARSAGVRNVRDTGICTGQDTLNFYSYRMERGQTGRMLAVLALAA